jgi:hypothetical protein
MGGTIDFESTYGKGSRFWIEFNEDIVNRKEESVLDNTNDEELL